MTARRALAMSRNTIAVEVLERLGLPRAIAFARLIGVHLPALRREPHPRPRLKRGHRPRDDQHLRHLRQRRPLTPSPPLSCRIIEALRPGNPLDLLLAKPEPTQVIPPESAFLITHDDARRRHRGHRRWQALKGWPAFSVGKTGTTNGPRDAWYIGFTPALVASRLRRLRPTRRPRLQRGRLLPPPCPSGPPS
jgi:penicillin-binding protein 1A